MTKYNEKLLKKKIKESIIYVNEDGKEYYSLLEKLLYVPKIKLGINRGDYGIFYSMNNKRIPRCDNVDEGEFSVSYIAGLCYVDNNDLVYFDNKELPLNSIDYIISITNFYRGSGKDIKYSKVVTAHRVKHTFRDIIVLDGDSCKVGEDSLLDMTINEAIVSVEHLLNSVGVLFSNLDKKKRREINLDNFVTDTVTRELTHDRIMVNENIKYAIKREKEK